MLKIKNILCTLLILALTTLPALSEGFQRVERTANTPWPTTAAFC